MSRIKLSCGAIAILLLCFIFSSYFTLTALAKLYEKLVNVYQLNLNTKYFISLFWVDFFSSQQYSIALIILLIGCCGIVLIVAYKIQRDITTESLKKIGWPLFLVCIMTQLLTLGMYFYNFTVEVPIKFLLEAGLIDVFVEVATILVISTLLFFELFILFVKLLQSFKSQIFQRSSTIDPGSIRPAVFLFLFGVDLSAAFVPLHMKNLYEPLFNLPKDVVLGLPISSMFLCVSFTIIISGIWLDRRGWHEPFLVGLSLAASAMLYAWLAPTAIHFIIAMGLGGLGYGLALMASQGFVIIHSDDRTKARSLAYLFAGIYAGSICGTAVGAMLAERIGYAPVFLLSAIALLLTLGYTFLTMRSAFVSGKLRNCKIDARQTAVAVTAKHYWNFLSNRYVLGLIFLSSLPSAIAVIGLLNYFGPVYLDRLGISQSIIGSVLVLYSICMVYFGPLVSKYIDASDNKRFFVFLGCVLGGGAFLSFHFFTGLFATVIAVLMLGISSCFVLASQTTYALTLDVTRQLGQGRAIGIFRASSRIGQMLGPILFGWLMIAADIKQGLTYFGIAYLITAILFLLLTVERRKLKNKVICGSSTANG
ncbi:MAG TPA: MFS transporter [Candidatus Competibacter sp.]|nr:MFS transporter [Candidatus Competibacter sp.]